MQCRHSYLVWFFVNLVTFLLPLVVLAHGEVDHKPITVSVTDEGFVPSELTIAVGETVTFENDSQDDVWPASDNHPTHEAYPEFDPNRPILPNNSWSFTFDEIGEWTMHDHLNPRNVGIIYVEDDIDEGNASKGFISRVSATLKTMFNGLLSWLVGDSSSNSLADNQNIENDNVLMTDFISPELYDDSLIAESNLDCSATDYACINNELSNLTTIYGPVAASLILERLMSANLIDSTVDDHQLSHSIGRNTARSFGVNPQAFELCPTDMFNGGCQHGYFEYVLGRTDSTTEAADVICKSLDESYSDKFKFYCYHGVGHGVMMQQAYDLTASLDICDSLDEAYAREGCWQGVFMENTNAVITGYAERDGVFLDDDPLAPCNVVDNQYRQQCYQNHSGYLMKYFGNDVIQATDSCLAADNWSRDCMHSIGLMVTNPAWQVNLHPEAKQLGNVNTAWELCKKFPDDYQQTCVDGGVDNINNFDRLDVTRADSFCSIVADEYKYSCYERIGMNLRNSTPDPVDAESACNQLSINKDICLSRI